MADVAPEGTFRFLVDQRRTAYWARGPLGSGWWGLLCGLIFDEAAEAWSLALRTQLLSDTESPDDVLPIFANERRLERYDLETAAQHRQRLRKAWDIYALGGSEAVIETQLREAGYGPTDLIGEYGNEAVTFGDPTFFYGDLGARIEFRPWARGPRGEAPPYDTQFWIVFGPTFHPVTGPPAPWGDWVWGETYLTHPGVWAPTGITAEFLRTVFGIVKKWKPSTHVFRGFTFVVSDVVFGETTVDYGDTSVLFGGSIDVDVGLNALG